MAVNGKKLLLGKGKVRGVRRGWFLDVNAGVLRKVQAAARRWKENAFTFRANLEREKRLLDIVAHMDGKGARWTSRSEYLDLNCFKIKIKWKSWKNEKILAKNKKKLKIFEKKCKKIYFNFKNLLFL